VEKRHGCATGDLRSTFEERDLTTMLIFIAPMVLLYFVGVLVSYMVLRKKRARDLATGTAH